MGGSTEQAVDPGNQEWVVHVGKQPLRSRVDPGC